MKIYYNRFSKYIFTSLVFPILLGYYFLQFIQNGLLKISFIPILIFTGMWITSYMTRYYASFIVISGRDIKIDYHNRRLFFRKKYIGTLSQIQAKRDKRFLNLYSNDKLIAKIDLEMMTPKDKEYLLSLF